MDVNGEVKFFCENSKKKIGGGGGRDRGGGGPIGVGVGEVGVARFGVGGGCGDMGDVNQE